MTDISPEDITAMCECSHHWYVHSASGQTAPNKACHGYIGSATPGPYEPCRCTGFRQWSGPRDARTGEPVKPPTMAVDARVPPGARKSPAPVPGPLHWDDVPMYSDKQLKDAVAKARAQGAAAERGRWARLVTQELLVMLVDQGAVSADWADEVMDLLREEP